MTALRGDEYTQGRYTLRWENGSYCCMGVLADLVKPDGWSVSDEYSPVRYQHPLGLACVSTDDPSLVELGITVLDQSVLTAMNDEGKTFDVIADWIEVNL